MFNWFTRKDSREEELFSAYPIGYEFYYMKRKLRVIYHCCYNFGMMSRYAKVYCHYFDNNGIVDTIHLNLDDLAVLNKENDNSTYERITKDKE